MKNIIKSILILAAALLIFYFAAKSCVNEDATYLTTKIESVECLPDYTQVNYTVISHGAERIPYFTVIVKAINKQTGKVDWHEFKNSKGILPGQRIVETAHLGRYNNSDYTFTIEMSKGY